VALWDNGWHWPTAPPACRAIPEGEPALGRVRFLRRDASSTGTECKWHAFYSFGMDTVRSLSDAKLPGVG